MGLRGLNSLMGVYNLLHSLCPGSQGGLSVHSCLERSRWRLEALVDEYAGLALERHHDIVLGVNI